MSEERILGSDKMLGTAPVNKVFWAYLGNGLFSMFIMIMQGVADSIFVGRGVGTVGLAAMAVCSSVHIILSACSLLFVMGGSSLASEALAKGNKEEARQYYAISTLTSFILLAIISIICIIFVTPISRMLGADEAVLPHVKEYMVWCMALLAPTTVGLTAVQFFNVEGKPGLVSKWMTVTVLIGVIGEYILVLKLNLGLAGASIGTSIFSTLLLLTMVKFQLDKNSVFKLRISDLWPDWGKVGRVVKRGLPFCLVSLSASFTVTFINNVRVGMNMDINNSAAYGVCQAYFKGWISVLLQGVFKGFTPLFSYNYGAGLYDRCAQILKMYLIRTILIMTGLIAVLLILAKPLGMVLTSGDEQTAGLIRIVAFGYIGMLSLGTACQVIGAYYMCLGKPIKSFLVGSSRQFWIMIPVCLIMSRIALSTEMFFFFGMISDILGGLLAILLGVRIIRDLRNKEFEPKLES